MDVAATWRAAIADERLRRAFLTDGFDDSDWASVAVPGHWRDTFDTDGPVLYRTSFSRGLPDRSRRAWLTFEGVFYDGDVWLDGSYVGATEGYFFPHTFEVTSHLQAGHAHVLGVEVGCALTSRSLIGDFREWDCGDPSWNPGGIWRPVTITESGPVRISRLSVLCPEASAERAQLDVRTVLDAVSSTNASLEVSVTGPDGSLVASRTDEHTLAHGENRIRVGLAVEEPSLWWPRALGSQAMHTVTVRVVLDDGDAVSDVRAVETGLRQVRMKNWITTVNGERLFLKGSNLGPSSLALATSSPAADVALAADAGLDLLRVHGHISRPELYDAADRAGMLLWQDLPVQGKYPRSVRKQAARQAREAVDLLGHHPAIALWCSHDRLGRNLPTVGRALQRADGSRPVVRQPGSRLYFGWENGTASDLPRAVGGVPSMGRFVGEFGAQAVPSTASWMIPSRWPDLDWPQLAARHAMQLEAFARHVEPGDFATFEEWQAASQQYQASVIRLQIEAMRRLKYRPTGGFCQYLLADAHPAVSWSVLDHARVPKAGYDALAAACAPVIVVATASERASSDRVSSDRVSSNQPFSDRASSDQAFDVHVVSDLRVALPSARVTATLGAQRWGWEGSVPADGCVYVGSARLAVSPSTTLLLSLAAGDVRASAIYSTAAFGDRIGP